MNSPNSTHGALRWTRREFAKSVLAGGLAASGPMWSGCGRPGAPQAEVFIGKADSYQADLASLIRAGLRELGVGEEETKGKTILLKPNLVETRTGAGHINTHPLVIRAAVEAFLQMGAGRVWIAEGPGHRSDAMQILEESGLGEVLLEDRIPFTDLNHDEVVATANRGRRTKLGRLSFPQTLKNADWIVSMPKLKTHHWVGATLSMKNLFGVMPGIIYGWPKNVLHTEGFENSIYDIYSTLRPQFAIADGIVGMEGDGPIMGEPRRAGVIVMGRNFPAVDATCARVMRINPHRMKYLALAQNRLGPIRESKIAQRGETIASVATPFKLLDSIPAHKGLRLS